MLLSGMQPDEQACRRAALESQIAADLRDADLREVLIDPETLARARLDGAKR